MRRLLMISGFVLLVAGVAVLALSCAAPTFPAREMAASSFPDGYLDSPYVIPSGRAIYFLHSPAPVKGFGFPWTKPACAPLPGHQAIDQGLFWFNTDLYVAERNPDGTYGLPKNLGPEINTRHLECCPWVSHDEKTLIFTRETLDTTESEATGTYISRRASRTAAWGKPERLAGPVGKYLEGGDGIHDVHLTPSGELYGWSEKPVPGRISRASSKGRMSWAKMAPVGLSAPEGKSDSQPWINDAETVMAFNRWKEMDRELWFSRRPNRSAAWGPPEKARIIGFEDPNGHSVWGEPSFLSDGTLFFTRFNTARPGWGSDLMKARRNADGSYGPAEKVIFRF